jgi:4-oxalocrotonate tautomerase
MPFVNVKLVDGVFSPEEKHAMAKALTDVMVRFEGPRSLMDTLGKSKAIFEMIDGSPTTRAELAAAAPVRG